MPENSADTQPAESEKPKPSLFSSGGLVTPPAKPAEVAPAAVEAEPDQYGRLRVHDQDTGHALTIGATALPHGNFVVLDEPASDATGLPLPPEHNRFPVEPITSGQEAENKEHNDA